MVEPGGRSAAPDVPESGESAEPYAEFNQPAFQEKFGTTVAANIREITLMLDGIHCAACIWLIEKLPQILPGVIDVRLNWTRQTVRIRWQADRLPLSQVAVTLRQLGYPPHPVRENQHELRRQQENRRHLVRIGVAAAAAGNNMLFASALYLGMFSYMDTDINELLRIASCLVGLASFIGPGRIFLRGAWSAIRTRTPHMDVPIALGLTVGSTAGVINTIRGTGEIYFDSLSVLIFLLLVGRWVQFRQQNRAADAVELLYRLTPQKTHKVVNGRAIETMVEMVQPDDLLEIRPGELVPVDAVIVEGATEVDESILSGESRPLRKSTGDEVLAGTQNRNSVIVVRAINTGRQTRLSKIVDLVEQASLEKPAVVQWANQIGGYFVVGVILLATLTFAFSWLWIGVGSAIDRAVALLIVACPCALALATPLAVSIALGRAAQRKLMVKSGDVLQWLNRPGRIWLDKTGTITTGCMEVVDWYGERKWQSVAAALESKSLHPVAEAIKKLVPQANVEQHTVRDATARYGGISGLVDQHRVLIGNEQLMRDEGIEISVELTARAADILRRNLSPGWIAVDEKTVAMVAVGDLIRTDTQMAVDELQAAGWSVGILSGDHQSIVSQVGERLGLPTESVIGGLTPEDKLHIIRRSNADFETVVMVGDGVNDGAALAAATVGIAVHNGAEASLAAAPVYLGAEGLQPILTLLEISKSTNRTMRTNFAISLTYNALAASLAAVGMINPLVAAILMPISSLTVVAMSLNAGSYSEQERLP
jgi:Cu2+-exporting ATPase